jgi:hypothetical protein
MERYGLGSTVYILVVPLDEHGNYVSGLAVAMDILRPDGGIVRNIPLMESGLSGVYYAVYNDTDILGDYLYVVHAADFESAYGLFRVVSAEVVTGYRVRVRAVDNLGNGVSGVLLGIYSGAGGVDLVLMRVTGVDGAVDVWLPPGEYVLRAWHDGMFFEDELVRVSGDTSVLLTGIYVDVGVPQDARLVRVYGFLADLGLSLDRVHKAEILFTLADVPQFVDNTLLLRFPVRAVIDRRTGFFYADVVRGIRVVVACPDAQFYRLIRVPDTGFVVRLRDLL